MRKTIITLALTAPLFSQAASFNCDLASTVVEKTICNDESLNKADERLNEVYKKAKNVDPTIVQAQREWVKVRNKATSVEELDSLHEARISELEKIYQPTEVKPMERKVESSSKTMERADKQEPTQYSNKQKDIKGYIQEIEDTGGIKDKNFGYLSAKEYTKGYPKWLLGCGYVIADNTFGILSTEAKEMNQFEQFQQYENEFHIFATNMAMESMIKAAGGDMGLARLACENM